MVSISKTFPVRSILFWGFLQISVWFVLALVLIALLFGIGHNLTSVENWIYIHCWEVILSVKIITLIIWMKWRSLSFKDLFQDRFASNLEHKGLSLVILFSFIFFSFVYLSGDFISMRKVLTLEGVLAVIAKISFYLIDFLVLTTFYEQIRDTKITRRLLTVFLVSLYCVSLHLLVLSVAHSVDLFYLSNILFSFSLVFLLKYPKSVGIYFHLIISVPFNLLTQHFSEPYMPWVELTHYISEPEYFTVLFFLFLAYTALSKGLLSDTGE